MNCKWTILLLLTVAAGVVAYGITRHAICGRPGLSPACLEDVSLLTRELGLSRMQAMEIRRQHTTFAAKLNDCCMRHCAARARLGQALAADTNGNAQADIVLAEMCRAYEEGERATLDQIRQVRAVLNAAQRKRFDAMISDCMCKPCRMHDDSCRTDAADMAARKPREK